MKTMSVRDLQKRVRECVAVAQEQRVVVTRHGRPAAILIGVEGQDWEQIALRLSPTFWKMVEERRREPTVSLDEARQQLETRWARARAGAGAGAGNVKGRPGVQGRARKKAKRPARSPARRA